mmetsp:Transcript_42136/g.54253  ORF Transcript_42136/g.54253 Transcript_42136/m.54253 type:complete len:83 (+) Transcript_42136:1359-1607(+)
MYMCSVMRVSDQNNNNNRLSYSMFSTEFFDSETLVRYLNHHCLYYIIPYCVCVCGYGFMKIDNLSRKMVMFRFSEKKLISSN